jgi:hypothetical protein
MKTIQNNSENTRQFLALIEAKPKAEILENIANHYGISVQEALEEVTGEGAEHLLDYMTGPTRAVASALMFRYSLAVFEAK